MFIFFKTFIHKKWCSFKERIINLLIYIITEIFLNFFLLIFGIIIFFLVSIFLSYFFLSFYFVNNIIVFIPITILYFFIFIFIFFFCKKITRFFIKKLLDKSIKTFHKKKL